MKTLSAVIARWQETAMLFFKFGIVGVIGFVVDAAMVYAGIYLFGLSRITAGLFSFPFAVTTTWFGNRVFTFKDAPHTPASKQLAKFAAACAVGLIFNRGTYSLVVSLSPFAYNHPVIGLLAGTAAGMFFNFFVSKKHIFV